MIFFRNLDCVEMSRATCALQLDAAWIVGNSTGDILASGQVGDRPWTQKSSTRQNDTTRRTCWNMLKQVTSNVDKNVKNAGQAALLKKRIEFRAFSKLCRVNVIVSWQVSWHTVLPWHIDTRQYISWLLQDVARCCKVECQPPWHSHLEAQGISRKLSLCAQTTRQ